MSERLLYEKTTQHNHYQVVDMLYDGRQARVLFSGDRQAAQSGVAQDGGDDLLFDYNQRFRELAASLKPKRVLLIGGGIYSLPMALRREHPTMQIDIVELDSALDEIAEAFFDFQVDERMKIIHMDGRRYVEQTASTYDLIFIDAFSHTAAPRSLVTVEAIRHYAQLLRPGGVVAVNCINALYGRQSELLQRQYAAYQQVFARVQIFPASHSLLSHWIPQNFVLVAQLPPLASVSVRYPAVVPAERDALEPWHDADLIKARY